MRIGIDCRTVSESAGIGEYSRQTVKRMIKLNSHDKFVLFFADQEIAKNFKQANTEIKILPFYKYKKYLPLVYSQVLVPLYMNWQKLDISWFPANIIPLFYRGRSIVTIHDLAVYKLPELFPDQKINFDRRFLVPASLKRASKIIAVSSSTKADIIELFKISPDKISVIYESGDFEFDEIASASINFTDLKPQKYFLFIGTIEPRKNLLRLIEAYKKFVQSISADYGLVLAGKSGWKNQEIFEAIKSVNQELGSEKIKYLGFISNEQKAFLYRHALALVFPSLYEGFGLPVAEALHFGLPIILADNSSLPEVGGRAALYVQADKSDTIFQALRDMVLRPEIPKELSRQADLQASKFIWEESAKLILEVIKKSI